MGEKALQVGHFDAQPLEAGHASQRTEHLIFEPQRRFASQFAIDGGVAMLVLDAEWDGVGDGHVRQPAAGVVQRCANREDAACPQRRYGPALVAHLPLDAQRGAQGSHAHGEEKPLPAKPQQKRQRGDDQRRHAEQQANRQHDQDAAQAPPSASGHKRLNHRDTETQRRQEEKREKAQKTGKSHPIGSLFFPSLVLCLCLLCVSVSLWFPFFILAARPRNRANPGRCRRGVCPPPRPRGGRSDDGPAPPWRRPGRPRG